MTTFITGGTSSIGRVLVKELSERGESMHILVRSNSNRNILPYKEVTFFEGDVTDIQSIRNAINGCDTVTHMAAVVGGDQSRETWYAVNVEGTKNVLTVASQMGISSMVQVSSLSVLGHTQPGELADESRPIDTKLHTNLYQKTKYAADEIAREFAGIGLKVKIVYPGFGFGCSAANSHASMQEQTLLRMAKGEPIAIMGSGKNRILLAYYVDTALGILLAHEKGKCGERYILGNENLSFPEIWKGIAEILGQTPPKRKIPLGFLKAISTTSRLLGKPVVFPQDFLDMISYDWCFSNEKAKTELEWNPCSYVAAMKKTWQDYQRLEKLRC